MDCRERVRVSAWTIAMVFVALAGCAPSNTTGQTQTNIIGSTSGSYKCPPGFGSEGGQQAKSDCSGKLGITVTSQSGEAAAACVNQGNLTYKCVAAESFEKMCAPNGLDRLTLDQVVCRTTVAQ
jgi:hypothetical protein